MRIAVLALAGALALAGCAKEDELAVDGAWVRLGAVKGRPAAAYFTLRGGAEPATLISVSSAVAVRTEIHESVERNGVAAMRPVAQVTVPARGAAVFAPGGHHAMLFDVNPGIRAGSAVPLAFTFADGRRLVTSARSVAAGAPAPE